MKCQTRLSLCSLFLGYANLYDLSFAAPCVDFCLKNLIKMRASPCLFFIKKLVSNLTNAISNAGALYWPISKA